MVLNNQEAQSRYDPTKLADLLTELGGLPELELTGFTAATLATLRLEPAPLAPVEAAVSDRVEVTLVTDAATYDGMAAALDKLIGEYELVAHVHRGE